MRALAFASLLLLAACGNGLYDAEGLPVVQVQPNTCDANQVVCAGDTTNTCKQETVTLCGSGCAACPAGPGGTLPVCNLGRAADGHGQCGYVCADGFFACNTDQCCPVVAVAAGGDSSYAIVSDGSVRGWGANDQGQLGDGSVIERLVPALVKLPAGTAATAVGAGPDHACAVTAGAVRCWGQNTSGQVSGAPTSGVISTPTATPVTSGAIAVAAGASHTCALLSSGSVACWGSNALGQLGGASSISGATSIAAGRRHTCAVVAGGAVKCWGANDKGQLGATPGTGGVATPIAAGIQHVTAYDDHTCAATESPTGTKIVDGVRCWGDVLGAAFQLAPNQPTPAIPMKDDQQSTIRKEVTAVATGRTQVCVLTPDGLQCFGTDNTAGQLGGTTTGATEPATVSAPGASFFTTGDDHACVILGTGALRCWGDNSRGQLGDDTTTTPDVGILRPPKGT